MAALTSFIQYGAQSSSQCNKARKYKKGMQTKKKRKNPPTENYVEHIKEATKALQKPHLLQES